MEGEQQQKHTAGKRENWQGVSDYWNLGSDTNEETDQPRTTAGTPCIWRFVLRKPPLSQLYSGYMQTAMSIISHSRKSSMLSSAQPPLRAPPAALHSKLHNPVFPTHHPPRAPLCCAAQAESRDEPARHTARPPLGYGNCIPAPKKSEVDRFALPVGLPR